MRIVLFILGLIVVLLTLFSVKLIKITREEDMSKVIDFLKKFLVTIAIFMGITYIALLVSSIYLISESEYIYNLYPLID